MSETNKHKMHTTAPNLYWQNLSMLVKLVINKGPLKPSNIYSIMKYAIMITKPLQLNSKILVTPLKHMSKYYSLIKITSLLIIHTALMTNLYGQKYFDSGKYLNEDSDQPDSYEIIKNNFNIRGGHIKSIKRTTYQAQDRFGQIIPIEGTNNYYNSDTYLELNLDSTLKHLQNQNVGEEHYYYVKNDSTILDIENNSEHKSYIIFNTLKNRIVLRKHGNQSFVYRHEFIGGHYLTTYHEYIEDSKTQHTELISYDRLGRINKITKLNENRDTLLLTLYEYGMHAYFKTKKVYDETGSLYSQTNNSISIKGDTITQTSIEYDSGKPIHDTIILKRIDSGSDCREQRYENNKLEWERCVTGSCKNPDLDYYNLKYERYYRDDNFLYSNNEIITDINGKVVKRNEYKYEKWDVTKEFTYGKNNRIEKVVIKTYDMLMCFNGFGGETQETRRRNDNPCNIEIHEYKYNSNNENIEQIYTDIDNRKGNPVIRKKRITQWVIEHDKYGNIIKEIKLVDSVPQTIMFVEYEYY